MNRPLLLFTTLLFNVFSAHACVCGQKLSAKQEYKTSQVVVSVKVLKVISSIDPITKEVTQKGDTVTVMPVFGYSKLLLVTNVYKGKVINDTLIIEGDRTNCELYLQVGQSYIIYANSKDGKLVTDQCSRSGLLSDHPDMAFLQRKIKKRKKSVR